MSKDLRFYAGELRANDYVVKAKMSNEMISVPHDYVLRLTPEAHSTMLGMVEHCLNVRACMGMDEGFKDFDTEEEHGFVKELRALLAKPAEQHQGEPVYMVRTHGSCCWVEVGSGSLEDFQSMPEEYELRALYTRPAEQPAPAAQPELQLDDPERQRLIAWGRNCGLEEASQVCQRMAHEAYYPPGTRFKHFTPKAQMRLGDILIKAANAIGGLPDGPYERFHARQGNKTR
ncbi:hypothetical protein [Pseudomonas sp. PH1b]|uniref:hypothetical protein n=1 Tax=Pseudomonas sp. PH1b TaxID=1397282 RepID=UPI000468C3B9|nr:hypothetical protein [Pseudomonas sp. PH1b]